MWEETNLFSIFDYLGWARVLGNLQKVENSDFILLVWISWLNMLSIKFGLNQMENNHICMEIM
jgi:hypothetical protein